MLWVGFEHDGDLWRGGHGWGSDLIGVIFGIRGRQVLGVLRRDVGDGLGIR